MFGEDLFLDKSPAKSPKGGNRGQDDEDDEDNYSDSFEEVNQTTTTVQRRQPYADQGLASAMPSVYQDTTINEDIEQLLMTATAE